MRDTYDEFCKLSSQQQQTVVGYFFSRVDIVESGFTDSKSMPDYEHAKYALDQFEDAIRRVEHPDELRLEDGSLALDSGIRRLKDLAAANLEQTEETPRERAFRHIDSLHELKIQNGQGFAELPEEVESTPYTEEQTQFAREFIGIEGKQTGKEFVNEQLQGSEDSSYKECPLCHKRKLYAHSDAKICTPCSQKLKAMGWYS